MQFQCMPTVHWLPKQLLLRDCLGTSWFWEVVTVWVCIAFFPPLFSLHLLSCVYLDMWIFHFCFSCSPHVPPWRGSEWANGTVGICCWPGSTHNLLLKHKSWPQKAILSSCPAYPNVDFRSRNLRAWWVRPQPEQTETYSLALFCPVELEWE